MRGREGRRGRSSSRSSGSERSRSTSRSSRSVSTRYSCPSRRAGESENSSDCDREGEQVDNRQRGGYPPNNRSQNRRREKGSKHDQYRHEVHLKRKARLAMERRLLERDRASLSAQTFGYGNVQHGHYAMQASPDSTLL